MRLRTSPRLGQRLSNVAPTRRVTGQPSRPAPRHRTRRDVPWSPVWETLVGPARVRWHPYLGHRPPSTMQGTAPSPARTPTRTCRLPSTAAHDHQPRLHRSGRRRTSTTARSVHRDIETARDEFRGWCCGLSSSGDRVQSDHVYRVLDGEGRLDDDRAVGADVMATAELTRRHGAGDVLALDIAIVAPVHGRLSAVSASGFSSPRRGAE